MEQRAAEAKQRAAASARRLAEKPRRRPADVELSAEDEKLLADLYALRKRLASKQKIPAYLVFSDATLREMVQKKPFSTDELLNITGVGREESRPLRHDLPRRHRGGRQQPLKIKRSVFHDSCIGCGKRNVFYNAALHCNFAVLFEACQGLSFERLPPAGGRCRVSDRGRRSWQCGALTERATSYGWKRPARPATRQALRRQGTWAHPTAAGSGCPGSGGRCRARPPQSGRPPARPAWTAARR